MPPKDEKGKIVNFLGIQYDVSHLKQLEVDLTAFTLKEAHAQMENQIVLRTAALQRANEQLEEEVEKYRQIEDALIKREKRLKDLFLGIPMPTYIWQKQGDDFFLIDFNEPARLFSEMEVKAFAEKSARACFEKDYPQIMDCLESCCLLQKKIQIDMNYTLMSTLETRSLHMTFGFVAPDLIIVHAQDVTEQKALMARSQQSQKMEAIGMLAGGVAHDFNNVLTVINGYGKLLLCDMSPEDLQYEMMEEICKAGKRASALTNQLLAFSRKQPATPVLIDLHSTMINLETFLGSLIPENIQLHFSVQDHVDKIRVDVSQFEQILMHLIGNAKDAMPRGGHIDVDVKNALLSKKDVERLINVMPGSYVVICVKDSGMGMADEIKSHIFEPFFTTKDFGKGTGLGLATVHGIVTQSGGWIDFESRKGEGTTFWIYFPSCGQVKSEIEAVSI